jgi:hypothetical protein
MSIPAKIYQITNPLGEIYKMWKELGDNLPSYSILEGTKYMYLVTVPDDEKSVENALSVFRKYNVEFIDNLNRMFDSDKFNNNYVLTISYFPEDNYYVLEKPYKNCYKYNGIRINEDGYPIDKDGNIVAGGRKLPACRDDPEWREINHHNYKLIGMDNDDSE